MSKTLSFEEIDGLIAKLGGPAMALSAIMRSTQPTADVDAEVAVNAAIIVNATALPRVVDFLEPKHFCSEAQRQIYETCTTLFRAKSPIDVQTVFSELRARNRLEQIGGLQKFIQTIESAPSISNVREYAVYVHDMWRRREVIVACQRIAVRTLDGSANVQNFIEDIVATFGKLALQNPVKPIESLESTLAAIIDRALNPPDREAKRDPTAVPLEGFPIGLPSVDRLLGGLRIAAKTTIVGLTGVGKTAFLLQVALFVAKQGIGVLIFSTEITRRECCLRLLSQESGVPARKIESGSMTPNQVEAVKRARSTLDSLPIVIDETPRLTIEQVAAITKSEKEKMLLTHRVRLGCVGFDYAQRSEPSRHLMQKDPHEQIAHFTKSFKQLMQSEKLAGVELAQGKVPRGGKNTRPNPNTDIADTTKIAKEADEVVFLVAENEPTEADPRVEITAWIGKNRAGPKARDGVRLEYRGDLYRFRDINDPAGKGNPSNQYVDTTPEPPDSTPSMPPGRFDDDDDDGSTTLTRGL